MDMQKGTFVKALVWNCIGLATMGVVGFIATGSFRLGGGMALANAALGLTMYVVYERIWDRVSWGRHV